MFKSAIRYGSSVILLGLLLASPAFGQEFRLPYFTPPEKPAEFWEAMHYELTLGNHKRAADLLKQFHEKVLALDEKEQEKLLLGIYDEEGITEFLRLSNIPELRKVKVKEGDKEVPVPDVIIDKLNKMVNKRLEDPDRLKFFVGNLALSRRPEEREYAVGQLRMAGPRAVPFMVEALLDRARSDEHQGIFRALVRMNRDAMPPLLAAFDSKSPHLQALLISLFLQRADESVVPYLWYLHAAPDQSKEVRQAAESALAKFLRKPVKEAGEAKAALTREAERYYKHEVKFPAGPEQAIWRWDDKAGRLAKTAATPSQVEEYYGVYWTKKALEIDPAYRPAQVMLLSILLDKTYERAGVEQPLSKAAPEMEQLLAATGNNLLEAVLDRAMTEGRTSVALGATRAMGPAGDWRLIRSTPQGPPPLVRALNYPDRRVQFAAADAVLQIPVTEPFPGGSRVIEVLRRAVMPGEKPKAVVAFLDQDRGKQVETTVRQWGYETVFMPNGREAGKKTLDRVHESADIDAIFLDGRLPDLAYVLSQLRSPELAGTPIVLITSPDQAALAESFAKKYSRLWIPATPAASPQLLDKKEFDAFIRADRAGTALTDAERKAQTSKALDWLNRIARGELPAYDVRPAENAVYHALAQTNDEWTAVAAEILSHRPGRKSQEELARLVLNSARSDAVRAKAAKQLHLHRQRFGILLKPEDVTLLVNLPKDAKEPLLREEAARLAASLQTSAEAASRHLRQVDPPLPQPPKEQPKEGEK